LLELVVVITVLGILAGAVSPAVVQQILEARIAATRSEAEVLYEGMMGRPAESGFGFVGDVGRLPATFQELTQPGGLPAYTTATIRGVGMGWRGPYVNSGTSSTDYLTDAFGRLYTGASSGRIRSAGPDGVLNNADDIVYPPSIPVITGNVTITLKETSGNPSNPMIINDPPGYRADLYYANNGVEASVSDAAAPFSFNNVPMGLHAVRIVKTSNPQSGTVVSEDTIFVKPGSATAAELWF
jgi:type II secretory pathway pseudopilin PulG